MTEQNNKKISLEEFDSDVKLAIRLLKTDVWGTGRLIDFAKKHAPEKELEIRREIRPLAVELLYEVIGTPKTFEEVFSEMDEQEDGHDE